MHSHGAHTRTHSFQAGVVNLDAHACHRARHTDMPPACGQHTSKCTCRTCWQRAARRSARRIFWSVDGALSGSKCSPSIMPAANAEPPPSSSRGVWYVGVSYVEKRSTRSSSDPFLARVSLFGRSVSTDQRRCKPCASRVLRHRTIRTQRQRSCSIAMRSK